MPTQVKSNFCPPYEANKIEERSFSQGGANPKKGGEGAPSTTEELNSTACMDPSNNKSITKSIN